MSLGPLFQEIVVTGIGVVTPIDSGRGTQYFWDGLCKGTDAIKPIKRFDVQGHRCKVGAEIIGEDPLLESSPEEQQNRASRIVGLACRHALKDAEVKESLKQSFGVAIGTVLGEMACGEHYMEKRILLSQKEEPSFLNNYCLHSIASNISQEFSLNGPILSINTACCSGADAIRVAALQIRNGRIKMMLAGGVDVLSEFVFRGFSALNALTTDDKVRPFDKHRTGLALGEGAGVVVLEEKSHAQARGAKIYCALAGSGTSADAYHLAKPNPEGEGLARAIVNAAKDARIRTAAVDYISAHGTGTIHNDSMETKAIKRAFDEKAKSIKVSSIKSMIGHTLGAASAIEAINCIKVIETGMIPPTINHVEPDPECDLSYVFNRACQHKVDVSMSLSAGFGGQNTALLFKRL